MLEWNHYGAELDKGIVLLRFGLVADQDAAVVSELPGGCCNGGENSCACLGPEVGDRVGHCLSLGRRRVFG